MNTLGKLSLILSLLCFFLTSGFKMALGGWMPFMSFGFGFGFFFLVFAIAVNLKYFRSLFSLKSFHFVLKTFLITGLLIVFLSVLNYIIFHQSWFYDLTQNRIHSLSPFTEKLVHSIDGEVHFHYLHGNSKKIHGYKNILREEIQKYQAINHGIYFQSYSIFKRPDLVKKFGLSDEESSLFVEFNGKVQRVFEFTERAFANAFLRLLKEPKNIYFLQMKDERKLGSESSFGIKGLKKQFERLHYQVRSLDTLEKIPSDISVLALVGSRNPFSEKDQNQLKTYLKEGGSLFLALDPGEDHNLNPLLKDYGLKIENNFIFSAQTQAGQSRLMVLTHKAKNQHQINQKMEEGQNPLFFIAGSISKYKPEIDHKRTVKMTGDMPEKAVTLDDAREAKKKVKNLLSENLSENDKNKNFKITPLLEYLPNSTAHGDIDPSSLKINKNTKWASVLSEGINKDRLFRLVLVGDSDFMTNQFYSHKPNFDFILNIFYYLSQDEDLLKIKTPSPKRTTFILTQTQINHYFIFFLLPLPFIFFILSLFFKLKRLF